MRFGNFRCSRWLAASLLAGLMQAPVLAQGLAAKPLRAIVPFPPGGTTDQIGRLLQPQLQQALERVNAYPAVTQAYHDG